MDANRKGDENFNWTDSHNTTFGNTRKGNFFFHDKKLHMRTDSMNYKGEPMNCTLIGEQGTYPAYIEDGEPVIVLQDCKMNLPNAKTVPMNEYHRNYAPLDSAQ